MNQESISITVAVLAAVISGLIIFLERGFPFILFSKKNPPKILRIIEKYIPPMVMAALLFYCLKDISFEESRNFLPSIIAVSFTVIIHILKRNFLLSVFGGTILYMILFHVM